MEGYLLRKLCLALLDDERGIPIEAWVRLEQLTRDEPDCEDIREAIDVRGDYVRLPEEFLVGVRS